MRSLELKHREIVENSHRTVAALLLFKEWVYCGTVTLRKHFWFGHVQ